jgi:hypothetical protein
MSDKGTVERPEYRKVAEDKGWATQTWMVVCDEGWAEYIVCGGMYEWAADWLIEQVQGKPYATATDANAQKLRAALAEPQPDKETT